MSEKSADTHQNSVDRFWRNYLSLLQKHSIKKRSQPWYRKHVEMHIASHKDLRLANHLPENIDRYLNAKGRLPSLTEWQFRQIADALRLLFCELIQPHWAFEYDWFKWRAFARDLEPDHPSLMRDGNAVDIVAPSSNPMVCKFRNDYPQIHLAFVKTIRIRQMAVRTEKTYEQWICRFMQFHHWPEIESLCNSQIKAYLEHLAVNRKVSASTQKLALNALIFLFREVLGQETEAIGAYSKASTQKRLPTVLSQDEIKRMLNTMKGRSRLMASLMYGTGMRLMECVRLRVQDIDFDYQQITVRMGKGGKDIRLVQELLGHADVSTTMIYTHVIKKGGLAVQSPFDAL